MLSRVLCAGLVAAGACALPAQPAKAWGGGAFAFGAALGVTTGVLLTRPYYPYPYPYPYYAPAPVYAVPPVPYGYAYPPGYAPGYAAYPPGYAVGVPPSPVVQVPVPYAEAAPPRTAPVRTPSCRAGQFFNTLTGNCDRR